MKFYKSILHSVFLSSILGLSIVGLSYNNVSADNTSADNGRSNTSTQINNNRLTLEKVPTLNFSDNNGQKEEEGSAQLGLDTSNDNNNNTLQVNDYRNVDNNNNHNWTLSAKLNGFSAGNSGHPDDSSNQWLINFNTSQLSTSLHNDYNNSNSNKSSYANSNNISIGSSDSNTTPIINGSYGITRTNYSSDNNINLNIPNVVPTNYTSSVDWSLNTTVSSNVNGTGHGQTS